jgi:RNA polymerase sigma factor (TIGR02999 family)
MFVAVGLLDRISEAKPDIGMAMMLPRRVARSGAFRHNRLSGHQRYQAGWHIMSDDAQNTLGETGSPQDRGANAELFASLYADLRRLADRELRRFPSAGVSPTTLVHEAYLNLASRDGVRFADHGKCLGYIARAMRGVLIDFSRRHQAVKRGSEFKIVELNTQIGEALTDDKSLTQLSVALDELTQHDPSLAELVDLKYFCGFSFAEVAKLRGISERTVQRDWQKVRLLLYQHINDSVS